MVYMASSFVGINYQCHSNSTITAGRTDGDRKRILSIDRRFIPKKFMYKKSSDGEQINLVFKLFRSDPLKIFSENSFTIENGRTSERHTIGFNILKAITKRFNQMLQYCKAKRKLQSKFKNNTWF